MWRAPRVEGPLNALVHVPGSKSETNRALVLAALSDGVSTIRGGLCARDSQLMIDGLRALGVGIDDDEPECWIVSPPQRLRVPQVSIDCGLAGTVMRFLPAVASLTGGRSTFIGDERASQRPLTPLLDGLSQLGVSCDAPNGSVPFTLSAPEMLGGPVVVIDSSTSSQFISALLLIGALLPDGLILCHEGASLPSRPHIAMTCSWLRAHGVFVDEISHDTWQVAPGRILPLDTQIAPDLTNAAVFLAAGLVTKGSVTIASWPQTTTQAGAYIVEVVRRMGAEIIVDDSGLTATCPHGLSGIDVDLHEASELTPVVSALAVFADGVTTIRGVSHIRFHETDRLAALDEMLSAVGVTANQTNDGMIIEGVTPSRLHGALLRSHADHRLAHVAALLGLVIDDIYLDDINATSKTMPDFVERWTTMTEAHS